LRHGSNRCFQVRRCHAIFLQRCREHAGSDGFGQQQDIARARADISPNSLRMDDARHCVAKLNIVIANRVTADDAALCFRHLRKAAANNLLEDLGITLVREAHDG